MNEMTSVTGEHKPQADLAAKILGLEKLYEDSALFAAMKKEILEKADYTVPGYLYNYLHYKSDNQLEFEYCYPWKHGKEDCCGIHIHCTSNDVFRHVSILDAIEADSAAPFYNVQFYPDSPSVPARIICPDVLPALTGSEGLFTQAIVFSDHVRFVEDGEQFKPKPAEDPLKVAFIGFVNKIEKAEQHFFGMTLSFWKLQLLMGNASFTLIVPEEGLKEPPRKHCSITGEGIISLDVAMPSKWRTTEKYEINYADFLPEAASERYELGYLPGAQASLAILSRCLLTGDFSRFIRCCGKSITFAKGQDRGYPVPLSTLPGEFSEMVGFEITSAEVSHVVTCPEEQFIGSCCLALHGADGRETVLVPETDRHGLLSTVTFFDAGQCGTTIDYELNRLSALVKAMAGSAPWMLSDLLAKDCTYRSEYAGRQYTGAERIMANLKRVASVIDESCRYTYDLLPAEEELRVTDDLPEIYSGRWCVHLYQKGFEGLAAVVFLTLDEQNRIKTVLLSRDGRYLKSFDAPDHADTDVYNPHTIMPLNALIRTAFQTDKPLDALRASKIPENDRYDIYVWKQADSLARRFLEQEGYEITNCGIEEECLGYGCSRKGRQYNVYVYAFEGNPTVVFDAERIDYLRNLHYSRSREILVLFLNVKKTVMEDGSVSYQAGAYYNPEKRPEIWLLDRIETERKFIYCPHPELYDLIFHFTKACNDRNIDVLRSLCDERITLTLPDGEQLADISLYEALPYFCRQDRRMKIAYMHFNAVPYFVRPCLEDTGYITFGFDRNRKITDIQLKPFENDCRELIVTERLPSHPYDDVPHLEAVDFLPPSEKSRFTMQLTFEGNEVRRFSISESLAAEPQPLDEDAFRAGVIKKHIRKPDGFAFTEYPERGRGIEFPNGLAFSEVELYRGSYPIGEFDYTELDGLAVSPDDFSPRGYTIGKIWDMDPRDPVYLFNRNTMKAKELPEIYWETPIGCDTSDRFWGGYSSGRIMVSTLPELDLRYHHTLMAAAGMWGWLDTDLNVVIPPQYVYALNFEHGHAVVCKGEWTVDEEGRYWCENEKWGAIDTDGNEVVPCRFDELFAVNDTDHLFLFHTGGREGHYGIYDSTEQAVILELDFNFDFGYMFNECYVDENNFLIFDDHLSGKGIDLVTVYDLEEKKYLLHLENWTERTYNGQKSLTVHKDGKDIIVF